MPYRELKKFIDRFNELKKETNNPTRLKWLLQGKLYFAELCDDLYRMYERIKEIEIIAGNRIIITPIHFIETMKEFEEKWKEIVKEGRDKCIDRNL